jgi:hypothetical protein
VKERGGAPGYDERFRRGSPEIIRRYSEEIIRDRPDLLVFVHEGKLKKIGDSFSWTCGPP